MAYFFSGQSHTFNEYLLVPGYSSSECIPDNVSLRTPLTRFRAGEEPALSLNVPMVSAVMQSVSGDRLAVALAQEGGVSFLYGSQSIEDEAAMVARVKSYKAGFVQSDSNISPDATLADILALREQTGHSTVAVTEDGTADGRLVGIVTSRDYRVSRMVQQNGYQVVFHPAAQVKAIADEQRIAQVVYNLVGNALTYTGEDKTVEIHQEVIGKMVRLTIHDSGKGIAPEELPLIWNRYYRTQETHKRAIIGSGLGLSIVRSILEKHNVPFGVDSKEGEGTSFWFELPLTEE